MRMKERDDHTGARKTDPNRRPHAVRETRYIPLFSMQQLDIAAACTTIHRTTRRRPERIPA